MDEKIFPRLVEVKRRCIEPNHKHLSVARQCQLVGLARSSWYYEPLGESAENLALMREIDCLYMERPFFGTRKVQKRFGINRKRAQRLMRLLGLEAVFPKRSTSRPAPGHKVYPYLLRNLAITRPDQVWASDITYIPLQHGFLYLTAVMDLYSRNVLSWRLSNTLTGDFCVDALDAAVADARPEIILVDIMMPRLDGYQTCALIKNSCEFKTTPVVMLSSKDGLFDKAKGRIVGSDEYITKPFSREDLLGTIRALVH